MRLVLISDTHGQHEDVAVPAGDMLLHAGDFSRMGTVPEVVNFMTWFGSQPHPHKIMIAGNHDFLAEKEPEQFRKLVPEDVIYLEDAGATVGGLTLWGSPMTPWFFDWAFNRERGEEIRSHWNKIPASTDILLTHGPPHGILDRTIRDDQVGCEELRHWVEKHPPKVHVFGHIHEARGDETHGATRFVNASLLDHRYQMQFSPVVFEL